MFPGRHHLAGSLALGLLLGLVSLVSFPGAVTPARRPEPPPESPRLAVLVVFDQLRADYLTRWHDLFGPDGFRRLEAGGAWFRNCHYPYADTFTGAGHASVSTGCSPDRHGVIDNDWYDREAQAPVDCVATDRYEAVPPPPGGAKDGAPTKKSGGAAPERLLKPTLADALKEATGGRGQVVSLSFKNRSAVLPGGRRPDACYWVGEGGGLFITSTYYRDRLHPWVEEFNRAGRADAWFGQTWDRLRPGLDYDRSSGPDDVRGEGLGLVRKRTFPHPLTGGPQQLKSVYYNELYNSPFGNDLLLGLARRALEAEKLGSRAAPDLLCLSFSSNDAVGHCWGPDSQEVLDVTLRSDLIVKQLLEALDAQVGKGRYVLALTADHGVCPLPEVARSRGQEAGRIDASRLRAGALEHLNRTFPGGEKGARWVEATAAEWFYLNRALLRQRGLDQSKVEESLAGWLRKQPGIQKAYTRSQLVAGVPPGDELGQRVRRSFHPGRSGDVAAVVKPYHLLAWPFQTGTHHGTPHAYDTHVPLLVYGPGVRRGVRHEAVTPLATAAILARLLGIKPPAGAQDPVPEGLVVEH
jgi:predicted AlkP superfamily pyrophosphatase or phosphodiesterase